MTSSMHKTKHYMEFRDPEGRPHRVGGPARVWNNGEASWWLHGELHREDGPAIISDTRHSDIWGIGQLYLYGVPYTSVQEHGHAVWVSGGKLCARSWLAMHTRECGSLSGVIRG